MMKKVKKELVLQQKIRYTIYVVTLRTMIQKVKRLGRISGERMSGSRNQAAGHCTIRLRCQAYLYFIWKCLRQFCAYETPGQVCSHHQSYQVNKKYVTPLTISISSLRPIGLHIFTWVRPQGHFSRVSTQMSRVRQRSRGNAFLVIAVKTSSPLLPSGRTSPVLGSMISTWAILLPRWTSTSNWQV